MITVFFFFEISNSKFLLWLIKILIWMGYPIRIPVEYFFLFTARGVTDFSEKNDFEKKNWIFLGLRQYKVHLSNKCFGNSPMHWRKLGRVTYIGEYWALWHTLEKSGWCDIHQRILGCMTYIGENWVVLCCVMLSNSHTLENSRLCDLHQRKLGGVTYIKENWMAWHILENSRLCDTRNTLQSDTKENVIFQLLEMIIQVWKKFQKALLNRFYMIQSKWAHIQNSDYTVTMLPSGDLLNFSNKGNRH